jgi:nitrite reductase/ring-hydroxylating ferredoxin subunit
MLPNQWYPLVFAHALQRRLLPIRRGGLDLVLFRDDSGVARCLLDRCPHRGVPLSLGKVRAGRVVCGYHGFEFNGGGQCVHMPCEGPGGRIPKGMDTPSFPVREFDGFVWLFWGAAERADEVEIPTLAGVDTRSGSWHERDYQWKIPANAALENNFDIHHFNFVHASKLPIIRVGTRIGEVEVLPLPHGLELRVEVLADDDGRGAQEFTVEYRAPTLQAIRVGKHNTVAVYDVPIDAHNTWRMIRLQQTVIQLPVLGKLASWAFGLKAGWYAQTYEDGPFALRVAPAGEDRPVRADAGITALRIWRRKALRAAEDDGTLPAHVRAAMAWERQLERAEIPDAG